MATTITKTTDVGSAGVWKMVISQTSQNQTNWTSTIRVRLYMKNTSPVGSYNNTGPSMSINGPGSNDWSDDHVPFNVAAGAEDLVADRSFTIEHNAAGELSAAFTATLGNTGTGTFGSGGSVSGTIVCDDLATKPGKPNACTFGTITDTTIAVNFTDNANNGGIAVDSRRIYYSLTNDSATAAFIASDGSDTVTGLTPNSKYYFWSRTHNSIGWSDFSTVSSATTKAVPSTPTAPAISLVRQFSFSYSFTDPADNGSPITAREISWALTPTGTKTAISVGGTSGTINTLPKGPTNAVAGLPVYIFVRVQNAIGWSDYSVYSMVTMVAGAYVYDNLGVAKRAVPFINDGGTWKLLEPYVNNAGVWKQTQN